MKRSKNICVFRLSLFFLFFLFFSVQSSTDIPSETDTSVQMVRILLHKNQSFRNIFIYGRAKIISKTHRINIASGTIRVSFVNENTIGISAFGRTANTTLPCTLSFVNEEKGDERPEQRIRPQLFSDDEKEYRGGIIFTGNQSGFSIINYIEVEDYLRGVVPLEIGMRAENEIEALKAQAIAARTYTLGRVLESYNNNLTREYDLLPTVADQVYGGASCEYDLSDLAIIHTRGIVITKQNGKLVNAYYHATCAGKTAAIDEVWRSSPDSSLVSRSDLREDGTPFCKFANSYSWKENWSINEFSEILRKYSREASEMRFDGIVRQISVISRSQSGRISDLAVTSDKGTFRYGKDKLRFVLRRPNKNSDILMSARFDINIENSRVLASGFGYGHGIGMCQNGAIGRARAGQNFSDILNAYYTGIRFSSWTEVLNKK